MLAVYRTSLLTGTPTPLRERLGRWLPMGGWAGQGPARASPGSPYMAGGLPMQSQYDLSDSFIATGAASLCLPVALSDCCTSSSLAPPFTPAPCVRGLRCLEAFL